MGKNLFIVRHAKSDWSNPDLRDIDRPLKGRGIRDAYKMAAKVRNKKEPIELILTSPATRAFHTAVIFTRVMKIPAIKIQINEALYLSGTKEILQFIKETSNDINSLMIFGHNPDFTDLANYFSPEYIDNVPTSGVVGFEFATDDWRKIEKSNLKNCFFEYPKKLSIH
jgi:phosphohistidine phosphatase